MMVTIGGEQKRETDTAIEVDTKKDGESPHRFISHGYLLSALIK